MATDAAAVAITTEDLDREDLDRLFASLKNWVAGALTTSEAHSTTRRRRIALERQRSYGAGC